jgi:hypothetical protein
MVHTWNPSNWEAEAGGLVDQCQTGLHSETLSPPTPNKKNKGFFLFLCLC